MISNHIVLYHGNITSYQYLLPIISTIIPYHIIYHIIPNHIISYGIILYHIKSASGPECPGSYASSDIIDTKFCDK